MECPAARVSCCQSVLLRECPAVECPAEECPAVECLDGDSYIHIVCLFVYFFVLLLSWSLKLEQSTCVM